MAKKVNGYIKTFFVGLAIAGIIWNAAVLHNDVKHFKVDIQEIKESIENINAYLMDHFLERSKE